MVPSEGAHHGTAGSKWKHGWPNALPPELICPQCPLPSLEWERKKILAGGRKIERRKNGNKDSREMVVSLERLTPWIWVT